MKLRIKFTKDGVMRYVGHLDLMRYFQKAIVRAKLPVAYSTGFNPHQIISFAAPLGIGLSSSAEYFDIELQEYADCAQAASALNEQMTEGVSVSGAVYLADGAPNAMSVVAACDYEITPLDQGSDLDIFAGWKELPEIPMIKKTKKSEKTMDIKPMIYAFEIEDAHIKARIASGSAANLKPMEMMDTLAKALGYELSGEDFLYHRTEIYAKNKSNAFVSLSDFTGEK